MATALRHSAGMEHPAAPATTGEGAQAAAQEPRGGGPRAVDGRLAEGWVGQPPLAPPHLAVADEQTFSCEA